MAGPSGGPDAAATADPTVEPRAEPRQGLRLLCHGVLQGVGFRPAVARLADGLGLDGRLTNIPGAVRLELAGCRTALECFLQQLPQALPPSARLEGLQSAWLEPPLPAGLAAGTGLLIDAAAPRPLGIGLVAPSLAADRAPCTACRRELDDPRDRRHLYPFISCCDCGPRYSIATAEPFSRAHTTLAGFQLCPTCQAEFDNPQDRRFHAETIGCPACGPRLRLLDGDGAPVREAAARTADPSPAGRSPAAIQARATAQALAEAVALLRRGGILALQGVGGFQLLVDAGDAQAVARLRERKRRPHKPFALLVDSLERLEGLVQPTAEEQAALEDPAAPIVLLPCSPGSRPIPLAGVAPGAPGLGVMLPASPLHLLLARDFAGPLVATSGNRSGEPLCIEPAEARERLAGIADAFLVHDRPIARPLDDSVLQLIDGRPALLRRSRGYAPEALTLSIPLPGGGWPAPDGPAGSVPSERPRCQSAGPQAGPADAVAKSEDAAILVGLGSDLRSAPGLAIGDRLWLAPHLGDLADQRCLERWQSGIAELLQRHRGERLAVAVDGHPQYLSTQLAGPLLGLPPGEDAAWRPSLQPVAHHRAHGLAVAAEHGLALPLTALVLDGLGYGGGTVPLWGCELLRLETGGATRLASLRPFPLPGGASAVREPRRSALGLLWTAGLRHHPGAAAVRAAFGAGEISLLEQAMRTGCNSPWCSAAGRLFDAAAALLNLVQRASHDAHAGLLLQSAAGRAPADAGAYPLPLVLPRSCWRSAAGPDDGQPRCLPCLDWQPLLEALLDDIAAGRSVELCAARFQGGLIAGLQAAVMAVTAPPAQPSARSSSDPRGAPIRGGDNGTPRKRDDAPPPLVLAGGCFQNRLLLEGLIQALRRGGWRPCWGERLPASDGGLAAGQILALRQPGSGTQAAAPPEASPSDRHPQQIRLA